MDSSSNFLPKLKKDVLQAGVRSGRLFVHKEKIARTSYTYYPPEYIKDQKFKDIEELHTTEQLVHQTLNCCGISELVLSGVANQWQKYYTKDEDFWKVLCYYLWPSVLTEWIQVPEDSRIIIFGAPIRVGTNSMYSVPFYKAVISALEYIGFSKLTEHPYKNKNSNNSIYVLAGQLPH